MHIYINKLQHLCPPEIGFPPIKGNLVQHEKSHHGNSRKEHRCYECPQSFDHKLELQQHDKRDHANKPFQCKTDQCQKAFFSGGQLEAHYWKEHAKPKAKRKQEQIVRNCSVCAATFNNLTSLLRHKRLHLGLNPYECKKCPKDFLTMSELYIHAETHYRDFKCKLCPAAYQTQALLTEHEAFGHGV